MLTIAKYLVITSVLLLTACSGKYSMLDPAGPAAKAVAWVWWAMLIVTIVIVIGICLLCWFAIYKKDRVYSPKQTQKVLNWFMIIGGIGLPTITIALLLIFGVPAGHKMIPWPEDKALQINVHAQQWFWQVSYPEYNISQVDKLHIPVGSPVDIHVSSEDVIHSFWVPRLGGKIDAIPGRTNVIRLQADAAGEYGGQCAEYCGRAHTFMRFNVIALKPQAFENWLQEQGEKNAQ